MTSQSVDHKPVEADYLFEVDDAPHAKVFVEVAPSVAWNALLDAKAWTEWLPAIKRVEWTSPKPYSVGTTRTVEMEGNVVDETFIVWEEGARMAFRFDKSSFPVTAGIEDYHVVEVPGGCELQWTCRMDEIEPEGAGLSEQMKQGFQVMLPLFKQLVESDPARFGG